MHRSHRTMTQYVIPRYAPMCLVLAGIVVIQIVDNFPISTIDMIMSAFSAVSHQKRIANSCCPSSAPEESPFIKDDSEECQLNSDSALLTQGMATVDETNGATSEVLVDDTPSRSSSTSSPTQEQPLKPHYKTMDIPHCTTNIPLISPTSPTPEFSLVSSKKDIELEDECWSPLPSFNAEGKLEVCFPLTSTTSEKNGMPGAPIIATTSPDQNKADGKMECFEEPTKVHDDENLKRNRGNKGSSIRRFYFSGGEPNAKRLANEKNRERISAVSRLFSIKSHFTEERFAAITKACGMPRYMNLALFRKAENDGIHGEFIMQDQFMRCWSEVTEGSLDDHAIMFNILRKPERCYLSPEDFLPVLEDVVCNHPGLEFLSDNVLFQERYIETVICRIYYENRCNSGKLSLSQFRRYNMKDILSQLERRIDLNYTHDCFSYKHFYVLYCKFWLLDQDHDLIVSQSDMLQYSNQVLTSRITARVMKYGKIEAFPREPHMLNRLDEPTLTYMDFIWFLLSEIDKTTRMSIEYWFGCMDLDEDGIISSYELSYFWEEQEERQRLYGICESEMIYFDDVICQINDLIKPEILGQFTLRDLKNSQLAERFFDTFINFHRMQIHESSHNSARLKRQYLDALSGADRFEMDEHYRQRSMSGSSLDKLSDWCAYAEIEYQHLVAAERNEAIWDDEVADLESCQQLDELDSEKMLSTVETLFGGDVDFGCVRSLGSAAQEDLEAILQNVAKTTFSSNHVYNSLQDLEDMSTFRSSSAESEDSDYCTNNTRRERKLQI